MTVECECTTWATDRLDLTLAGNGHHYRCPLYVGSRVFNVPVALIDDFNSQKGWWSFIGCPNMKEGDYFVMEFGSGKIATEPARLLRCVNVIRPGGEMMRRSQIMGGRKVKFVNWWIVEYEDFDPAK